MGVKNFYKVLQREGWLPDDASVPCCSTSLWRDASVMHRCPAFAERVEIIPKRSIFFLDGSGLAFHLYRTAYARHIRDVLSNSNSNSSNGKSNGRRRSSSSTAATATPCQSCSAKKLTPDQATKLLPNLLPLSKLDEVTREFVQTLQTKHHIQCKVYFDGEYRREAKRAEDAQRRQKRPSEWSSLQQYCCNGVMPTVGKICGWESRDFPKNRLFIEQIKYTLSQLEVEMVVCQEEADAELVKAAVAATTTEKANNNSNDAYVVGWDTDFCFFQSAKYIPLKTLHAGENSSVITASVISREALATCLNLPDSNAMVELAILMRNDYVGTQEKLEMNSIDTDAILDHLRSKGKGYQVKSTTSEDTQKAIRFVRTLYNLGNLDDEFPLIPKYGDDDAEDDPEVEITGPILKVPDDFPDHLAELKPGDKSVKGAIIRCLQAYVDQIKKDQSSSDKSNNKPIIREEHLEAFRLMSSYQDDDAVASSGWKPRWEDVPAAFLIASCILYCRRKTSPKHPLLRLSSPDKLFDEYKFHATLQKMRKSSSPTATPQNTNKNDREATSINTDSNNDKDNSPRSPTKKPSKKEPRIQLPVDEHEETILSTIHQNRVTIIQGETGCGKSSRVPLMIMNAPPPEPLTEVKLFISQPRRIAAKALVERLRSTEPDLGRKVALRMGHGVREYENSGTKAWFVTTGYLVRLLANHPENFAKVSHLIIDEIHERSVDTDILCLLCRRLLQSNSHIRLVLMSATLAAKLYQDYFGIPQPPIKVGARRFPIETIFVEEIPNKLHFPPKEVKAVKQIENECRKTMCIAPPTNSAMECVYSLAARIAISVGKPGSSVLIFVPGMADIVSIAEKIESTYVPGVTFTVIPVHSDIPFEDQMTVFDEMEDEVKIIIATNAAESSLTLPDCDHVIDTGLEKKISYNAESHRQILLPCWISRASAQQRSGRVGRVRPGQVYRLYTREAYESMMAEFESGEMLRMPLDSVILMLKEILNDEPTTPVLMSCIEPPDLSNIDRSYTSLFKASFISQPDDDGSITVLGAFVTALGIDLTIGRLIGLGIQFGVGPEAIELAAVLSFPKTPWLLSNPLIHKPNQFNSGSVRVYVSKNRFDAELFSEPFATMNLMYEYSQLNGSRLTNFCTHHGVHQTRIRRLMSTHKNIISRVSDFLKMDPSLLKASSPPARICHSKLSLLRTIQCWLFCDTIIEFKSPPLKPNPDGSVTIALRSRSDIKEGHLNKLLRADRHRYRLNSHIEVEQSGGFRLDEGESFALSEFLPGFEERFISFIVEKEFDIAWYWYEQELRIFVSIQHSESPYFDKIREILEGMCEESDFAVIETKSGRGRAERASGMWTLCAVDDIQDNTEAVTMKKFAIDDPSIISYTNTTLRSRFQKIPELRFAFSLDFSRNGKKKNNRGICQVFTSGEEHFKLSHTDFCDLLAIPNRKEKYWLSDKKQSKSQAIVFESVQNHELEGPGNTESSLYETEESSWKRPLLNNIPEGARLLSVLASSRRRENNIQLSMPKSGGDSEDDEVLSFSLDDGLSRMANRWTRINTDRSVFVFENSVPASVVPMERLGSLYSCCSNVLELKGGSIKAEGLTLLPPGSYFLLLSHLAFAMTPDGLHGFPKQDTAIDEFIECCLNWVKEKDGDACQKAGFESGIDWPSRIKRTIEFAWSCSDMGEQLVCFPEKVRALCEIFDGVDGYKAEVWGSLESNPFTAENRRKHREFVRLTAGATRPGRSYREQAASEDQEPDRVQSSGQKSSTPEAIESPTSSPRRKDKAIDEGKKSHPIESTPAASSSPTSTPKLAEDNEIQEEKKSNHTDMILRGSEVEVFSRDIVAKSQKMFEPELRSSETLGDNALPTTNILALCIRQFYAGLVYASYMQPDIRHELVKIVEKRSVLSLNKEHWMIQCFNDQDGKAWYRAIFIDSNIPLKSRSTKGLASWIKYDRPYTKQKALECCPTQFRDVEILETEVYEDGDLKRRAVLFESIEIALRMEAAFFLERTFCTKKDHWYEQGLELMQLLLQRTPPVGQLLQTIQRDTNFSVRTTSMPKDLSQELE